MGRFLADPVGTVSIDLGQNAEVSLAVAFGRARDPRGLRSECLALHIEGPRNSIVALKLGGRSPL